MTDFKFANTVIAAIESSRFGLANQAAADGDAHGALNGITAPQDLLKYLKRVFANVPSADLKSRAELNALLTQVVKDAEADADADAEVKAEAKAKADAEHESRAKSSRRDNRIFFWRMMGLIAVFWLGVLALVLYHLPTIRWLISLNG